jgi:hypothetical protein
MATERRGKTPNAEDIGIPDETEHAGEPQNRRSGQRNHTRTLFQLSPARGADQDPSLGPISPGSRLCADLHSASP